MDHPKIILSSGKDQSVHRFHPWVFSGAIKKIKNGKVKDGDVVEVYDNKDKFLGIGHYQDSSIAVRIFSFEKAEPTPDFWQQKIQNAYDFRKTLGLTDNPETNCYRLIHAEGDGMPGLIVDYYNGTCVMQCHSIGMYLAKKEIAQALEQVYNGTLKAVFDKSTETLPKNFAASIKNEYLFGKGEEENHWVKENGLYFWVDWKSGQKTGFFLDQRENRRLLEKYSKERTILNAFCYTGSFSLYAMKGGAKIIHSVDSSKRAIELVKKNFQRNVLAESGKCDASHFCADVFDFLKGREDFYDLIILDPPAFAKHQDVRHHAVMGYKRLNAEAIKRIKVGGIIFTFSCSQVVSRDLFEKTVLSAAIVAGRNVRVIHHLSQSPDHPTSIYHPEGEYLKGLVLYVE